MEWNGSDGGEAKCCQENDGYGHDRERGTFDLVYHSHRSRTSGTSSEHTTLVKTWGAHANDMCGGALDCAREQGCAQHQQRIGRHQNVPDLPGMA